VQTGIVYYLVDLAPEASRFFTFLFIMFLVSSTANSAMHVVQLHKPSCCEAP
jgi:hypothetical protein